MGAGVEAVVWGAGQWSGRQGRGGGGAYEEHEWLGEGGHVWECHGDGGYIEGPSCCNKGT